MSFSSLPLAKPLLERVAELGYEQPTPIQSMAIPVVLGGVDVMARAQTGTGKTAAFALPMINMLAKNAGNDDENSAKSRVTGLVLVPTRELAQQVFTAFEAYSQGSGLRLGLVYGGVSIKAQVKTLATGVDVLVATPGRLLDHLINDVFTLDSLKMLVFDEADRMLDMGFKDEISRLLKRIPAKRQTLLFSATFDDDIYALSKTLLDNPKRLEVDPCNKAAAEVEQLIYAVDKNRKRELTSYLIGSKNWQQVLIFVRTKQGADELAKQMKLDGIKTAVIHGDKSQGARDKALADFKSLQVRALIATDVASRGIDIRELKYVINYQLPHNPEDYVHRIGRTGRAGEKGLAISLMSQDEAEVLAGVEKVLDTRLTAQWYPGYEPDLSQLDSGRPRDKAKAKRGSGKGRKPRRR